jgi:hypothetical protein
VHGDDRVGAHYPIAGAAHAFPPFVTNMPEIAGESIRLPSVLPVTTTPFVLVVLRLFSRADLAT